MPYESLTCPKCGSGDCQEVKPGTHFCNHCDNVFKHVPPAGTSTGVAACATCGVVAVGLCLTCNRYFCGGHQAVKYESVNWPTRYTDLCTSCLANELAAKEASSRQADQKRKSEQRRIAECVHILDSRGGTGLQERTVTHREYKSFLGILRKIDKVVPIEPAWPVGDLKWTVPERWDRGETLVIVPSGITRSLDLVPLEIFPADDRKIEAWSPYSSEGPLGNDSVRLQVLNALERIVAGSASTA
jgi:hypothetical protein